MSRGGMPVTGMEQATARLFEVQMAVFEGEPLCHKHLVKASLRDLNVEEHGADVMEWLGELLCFMRMHFGSLLTDQE